MYATRSILPDCFTYSNASPWCVLCRFACCAILPARHGDFVGQPSTENLGLQLHRALDLPEAHDAELPADTLRLQ